MYKIEVCSRLLDQMSDFSDQEKKSVMQYREFLRANTRRSITVPQEFECRVHDDFKWIGIANALRNVWQKYSKPKKDGNIVPCELEFFEVWYRWTKANKKVLHNVGITPAESRVVGSDVPIDADKTIIIEFPCPDYAIDDDNAGGKKESSDERSEVMSMKRKIYRRCCMEHWNIMTKMPGYSHHIGLKELREWGCLDEMVKMRLLSEAKSTLARRSFESWSKAYDERQVRIPKDITHIEMPISVIEDVSTPCGSR